MYYIGIDLGGTNVAAGITDENGTLLGKSSIPTPRGADAVADTIAQAAQQATAAAGLTVDQAQSVGVASPGSIDPEQGVVEHAFNLDFDHVPLSKLIWDRLHLNTVLENDANAAALGEFVAGAGRGAASLVAVTLGTGVGGGAVLNGKLYTGFNYAGMEVGHIVIQKGGEACTCGRKGCFEAYSSATALIRMTRQAMLTNPKSAMWKSSPTIEAVNGRTSFACAQRGDSAAQAVVDQYIDFLACGLTNLINIFQPEVLCLGGGVSRQGDNLLKPLQAIIDREDFVRDGVKRTRISIAQLGNDAGIIGAALVPLYRV